jgi:hypothetical protein
MINVNYETMWNDLVAALLAKKTSVRELNGAQNSAEIALTWVLREMQTVDPAITDELLTYPSDAGPFTQGI